QREVFVPRFRFRPVSAPGQKSFDSGPAFHPSRCLAAQKTLARPRETTRLGSVRPGSRRLGLGRVQTASSCLPPLEYWRPIVRTSGCSARPSVGVLRVRSSSARKREFALDPARRPGTKSRKSRVRIGLHNGVVTLFPSSLP